MDAQTIAQGLDRGSRSGEGWTACCPAHDDRTPSLSITDSADSVLVHCHAGCSQDEVIDALKAKGLWEPKPNGSAGPSARRRGKIVATYDYVTEQGELAYQVVRFEPKDFRQRRPDGDGWQWNLRGVTRVPYRLPEIMATSPRRGILIVEGEKDADNLAAIGVVATTCPGGAER